MKEDILALQIDELKVSLRRLRFGLTVALLIGALLCLVGWKFGDGVLRGHRLEIVDDNGVVRALISTTKLETNMTLFGASSPSGGLTPVMSIQLGKNSQVVELKDEPGSLRIDSDSVRTRDPKGQFRIEMHGGVASGDPFEKSSIEIRDRKGALVGSLPSRQ